MASYIKTLKEDNGDITYPQTKGSAVLLEGGSDLETELASKATTAAVNGKISIGDVQGTDLTASAKTTILNMIYPVGSIYASVTMSTAAQVMTAFGGTWVAWGAGRVPVGVDTSDTAFNTVEETGGEKTHTLTTTEMPKHRHKLNGRRGNTTAGDNSFSGVTWSGAATVAYSEYTGGDGAHNNLQPYITCYMYKRTA